MKKFKLLILPIIFFLTGCYNYREINDLAITSAIGIDKINDEFIMTFQVINTQKASGTDNATLNPNIIIYEGRGKTIQEASRKIILESPKRAYANHISLLIISEEIAKEGINDILDLLLRDPESRKQFLVLISKNAKSKDILEILTPLETINSQNIVDSITSDSTYLGITQNITFENLLDMYLNENKEIILPSIEIKGNNNEGENKENIESSTPKTRLILSTFAIFKKDKLIGYTTEEESISINIINNKIKNTLITTQCENDKDKYMTIELINSKTTTAASKDKLEINISVKANGTISEINCNIDLEKSSNVKKIETIFEKHLQNQIKNSISNFQNKYQTDIFNFKDLFYKTNPKFYYKIKDNYNNTHFKDIKINTKIDIELKEKGNVTKVISNEK